MRTATVLAAAALAMLSTQAVAQNAGPADACLAEVNAIDAGGVGPAGPGEVNKGMQAAQESEAQRLQAAARAQAESGDAEACRRTLGLLQDLVAENRQQLPTQQDLATGQPAGSALKGPAVE